MKHILKAAASNAKPPFFGDENGTRALARFHEILSERCNPSELGLIIDMLDLLLRMARTSGSMDTLDLTQGVVDEVFKRYETDPPPPAGNNIKGEQ